MEFKVYFCGFEIAKFRDFGPKMTKMRQIYKDITNHSW